ncbi:hypothetical protein [Anaeromicropila herbilytica]|uniref:hypothetical protein n=1 Tax=Anaeromicropila herbilytica TaxID=2785025 RepID=UPI00232A6919|nr:hypothetical protein [Anaeromicropila herbilytica]
MKNMKKTLPINMQKSLINCVKTVADNKQQKDWSLLFHEIVMPNELLQQRM